ncbi:MAG: DUF2851 family protein [Brumimicrobium sp.]|nr:DUF2851 family protein [Brumimicrobium sp.]
MQEEYLHYLWRMKRLPLQDLNLTDGRKVEILNTGWHNTDPGPDFFNGTIKIDGIKWSGNIELHVKSSDWYLHKHHLDGAYDNVVLHVVYEHDKDVLISGEKIPVLELKELIDSDHWQSYSDISVKHDEIPCSDFLPVDNFIVRQQINVSLFHRLEKKGWDLQNQLHEDMNDKNRALLTAIFSSFGGRVNKYPMTELAQVLPLSVIFKEKWNLDCLESLLFGCAGFLHDQTTSDEAYFIKLSNNWRFLKTKYSLPEMNVSSWKFGGIRPFSFPTLRLAQLAAFIFHWDFRIDLHSDHESLKNSLLELFRKPVSEYWNHHFVFGKYSSYHSANISESFFYLFLINGIVPYLIYLKNLENEFEYIDLSLNILEDLRPETNNIIQLWDKLGVISENAAESQGLIELKNEFCNFKKCLNCKIGSHILERSKVEHQCDD